MFIARPWPWKNLIGLVTENKIMNYGVGDSITLPKENLKARKYAAFSPVESGVISKPPVITGDNLSTALEKFINPFPEFLFEKIAEVHYGDDNCIARTTGYPATKPSFMYDYYFIGMMRCIDKISKSEYQGQIVLDYDTPKPSS